MFIPQELADEINSLTDKFIEYYLTDNYNALDKLISIISNSVLETIILIAAVRLKHTKHYLNYLEDFDYFITEEDVNEVEQEYLLKSKQLELEQLL